MGLPITSTRNSWKFFDQVLDRLDCSVIEQFCPYEGDCTVCGTKYYGILDESKLTLPIYDNEGKSGVKNFLKRKAKAVLLAGPEPSTRELNSRIPDRDMVPWSQYTPQMGYSYTRSVYECRMEIVRSGIYTREQLRGALFTQHELAVADRAFKDIRPRRCDCDFGPWEDLDDASKEALVACGYEPQIETAVESQFVGGNPVPTGLRRRSRDAHRRRKRNRSLSVVVEPLVRSLPCNEGSKVELRFKNKPCAGKKESMRPRVKKTHRHRGCPTAKNGYKPSVSLENRSIRYKQDAYFMRKNGFFYRSQHHPGHYRPSAIAGYGPWSNRGSFALH